MRNSKAINNNINGPPIVNQGIAQTPEAKSEAGQLKLNQSKTTVKPIGTVDCLEI